MHIGFAPWLGSQLVVAWVGLSVATLLLPACSSNGDTGTLSVTWTVNSTSDATLCDNSVGWVVVQVTDALGNRYASSNAPCSSFSISFTNIPAGDYSVSEYMFNANDNTTLSKVSAQAVSVTSGETMTDSINFAIATPS